MATEIYSSRELVGELFFRNRELVCEDGNVFKSVRLKIYLPINGKKERLYVKYYKLGKRKLHLSCLDFGLVKFKYNELPHMVDAEFDY